MIQIPLKLKHRTGGSGKSYARNHSGNGNKKKKKFGAGNSKPYFRDDHVLVLQTNGKKRFFHYEDAHALLGR